MLTRFATAPVAFQNLLGRNRSPSGEHDDVLSILQSLWPQSGLLLARFPAQLALRVLNRRLRFAQGAHAPFDPRSLTSVPSTTRTRRVVFSACSVTPLSRSISRHRFRSQISAFRSRFKRATSETAANLAARACTTVSRSE